jgi:DNA polymerase-3 subunit gamma/tau
MRDGLSLTDQAIAFGNGALKAAEVRQMLGALDDHYILDLIGSLAKGAGTDVIESIRSMQQQGLSAAAALEQMTDVLHRMLVWQVSTGSTSVQRAEPSQEVISIAGLADLMPAEEIQLLYSICLHGRADLGLASDEYAALTMILLRLLAFKPKGGAAEPLKKLPSSLALPAINPSVNLSVNIPVRLQPVPPSDSKTERLISVASKVNAADSASSKAASLEPTVLGDKWFVVVQRLIDQAAISALVRELALQSQLVEVTGENWVLQVENNLLANPAHLDKLQLALQQDGTQAVLKIRIGAADDTPALRAAQKLAERLQEAQAAILNDPLVQQVMREFDGKIVVGSIQPAKQ